MDRWIDFVNRPPAGAAELAAWAATAGWAHPGLVGGTGVEALVNVVSDALRVLATALTEQQPLTPALAELDRILQRWPGRMRAGAGGVAFEADAPPLVQIPLRAALEAATFAISPGRLPLKRCERVDPSCGRFFVDRSRDGRGRWCSQACGSVERVRRLRQKDPA